MFIIRKSNFPQKHKQYFRNSLSKLWSIHIKLNSKILTVVASIQHMKKYDILSFRRLNIYISL